MKLKLIVWTLASALPTAAFGGSALSEATEIHEAPATKPAAFIPAFDALVASYEIENGLGFDDSSGELDGSRIGLMCFLNQPVGLGGDWSFLPAFEYNLTSLDFNDTPSDFPIGDEDLHKIAFDSILYHNSPGSRWLYGGWARVNFASDTQHVDGDDFYVDVAAGAAYMVTDHFLLGLGVAGLELGSDSQVLAGPGFYWKPNMELDVDLIGVLFNAIWSPSDDWAIALRGLPFGNNWNIDNGGSSQQLDFSSYTLRLHVERRLYRDMWLSVGVGYAFANTLELRDSTGDRLFKDDLDGGLSGSIGLRVRTW